MGKGVPEQVGCSKVGVRKSKRLHLSKIAHNIQENDNGRISSDKVAEVAEVAQTLPELNGAPIPPVIPPNSTSHPNSSTPSNSSTKEHGQSTTKRKRGKTMMKSFSQTPGERAIVEFNQRGQPIGPVSNQLSSYLGTLAREMIPVNINKWKNVDDKLKDDLWTCIQTRFVVDQHHKGLLMMMLGVRWKEAKSRLVKAIQVASKSPDSANRLANLKPYNIRTAQEWEDFIKEKLSKEFELKSKKFKDIRAKNKIPHTMSRKGYARLEEDLKKEGASDIDRDDLWIKGHTKKNGEPPNSVVAECITKIKEHSSSQSSGTVSISEDGVAKTLGKERCGRVRGLGFGVTPSRLGVYTNNSKKVSALENEVSGLKNRLQELEKIIMTSMTRRGNLVDDPLSPPATTPQSHSHHGSTSFPTNGTCALQLPKKCKLLNWKKKVVAEGTLTSIDPNALVHHIPLGADTWKVWVDIPVEPLAPLWRETSEACTIEQAVGTTVAWHKDFIVVD